MSLTPRSGGALAAQLQQISHNKMLSNTNTKPTSAQLNQLMSENANLKSRLHSTIDDLREAREIYEKQHAKWRQQYEKMKEALSRRAANANQYESLQRSHQQRVNNGGGGGTPFGGVGRGTSRSPTRSPSPRARLALSNLYELDKERGVEPNPAMQWVIAMPPWQGAGGGGASMSASPAGARGMHASPSTGAAAHPTAAAAVDDEHTGSFFADRTPAKRGKKTADGDCQTDVAVPPRSSLAAFFNNNEEGSGRALTDDGSALLGAATTTAMGEKGAPTAITDPEVANIVSESAARAAQIRLLNAEVLKLQSENTTLRGSIDMLKRDVASDASGQIVRRYEEIATQQIRALGRALEAANAAVTAREREIMHLKESNGHRGMGGGGHHHNSNNHRATPSQSHYGGGGGYNNNSTTNPHHHSSRLTTGTGRRSPSVATSNSIRPSTAGVMQQMLLRQAREKARSNSYMSSSGGDGVGHGGRGGGKGGVLSKLMGGPTSSSSLGSGAVQHYYNPNVQTSSIGVGTDQPWVESPPAGSHYAHDDKGSREVVPDPAHPQTTAVLQHSLELAREQLRQALEELAMAKATTPLGATLTNVRKRTSDVGSQVSEQSVIERLFVLFHEECSPANVERILAAHQNKTQNAILALTEAASYTPNDCTQLTLQATRSELIAAHEHIEELEFALELERREKQRALDYVASTTAAAAGGGGGSPSAATTPGEAARQAAHEIAFLCDTLSATKMENEMLHEKLHSSEKERANAMQALAQLKKRSNDLVKGCESITEVAKNEAEAAMISLMGQVHQKASEASQLRGLLSQAKRSNENLQQQLDEMEKELIHSKTKLFNLRDTTAKLREDYNLITVQLRQAKETARERGMSAMGGHHHHHARSASPFRNMLLSGTANGNLNGSFGSNPMAVGAGGVGGARERGTSLHRDGQPNHTNGYDSPREGASSPLTPRGMNARFGGGVGAVNANGIANTPRGPQTASSAGGRDVSALEMLAGCEASNPNTPRLNPDGGACGASGSLASGTIGGADTADNSAASRSNSTGRKRTNSFYSPNLRNKGAVTLTVDAAQLISEDDCRLLLEQLVPFAPGAITPAQIVDGALNSIDLLNDRITELEAEVKAKTGNFNTAKKDVALLQQRIRRLETEREIEKARQQKPMQKDKKELFAANQNQQMLRESLKAVEEELDATRARLADSEREIEEGRALMMRLIQE